MPLSSAPVVVALAAPLGVVAGHTLGYQAADPHAHVVSHSYLGAVAAIAAPLAVAALAWAALSETRLGPRPAVPTGSLVAAQWALFVGQEMAEHALAGHGPAEALRSPAVWLGLVAQALVALAVALLLRAAGVTGARILASLSRVVGGATAGAGWPPSTGLRSPSFLPARRPTSRGPPPVLA